VSQADMTDAADQTRVRAVRQPTGDHVVDDVLGRLDAVTHEPLDIQIEVGTLVQDVLQGRLADLDQE
jgi:hypothetical protein